MTRIRSASAAYTAALIAALIDCSPAAGADIAADLHVDRVTVYQEGAVVTRTGSVSIPAGTNRLLIKGLPARIESKSLHVAVDNRAVRLGEIELAQINEGNFVSAAERELRGKLEQLTDQRTAVQDEAATGQLQLKLLESLAANPAGSPTKATVDGGNLSAVLATMGTSSAAARKRVRDSNLRLRELDREIDRVKADLAKVATQSRQSTDVQAAIEADADAISTVTVSYTVPGAGWQWIYEARLDTTKKHVTLGRQGQVRQGSGEDWKNVELTLTTALPTDNVATPVVGSLFLNLEEPRQRAKALDRSLMAGAAGMAAPAPSSMLQELTQSANRPTARVETTEFLAEYKIPGRVTLLADREPRLYLIADDAFDVNLVARVVPSAGPVAHLEAGFKYDREFPLENGQLQLYRDGAYVGEAETRTFLPGAQVRLPFGVDERIRVAVHNEPAQSAERGVISKLSVKETRLRFDVTSYHPSPMTVEVIDRIPVSQHADVHVETLKGATEPTTKDPEGKAGVLLWRFDAQPQKTVSIHHYFSVEYPRDRQMTETRGDASE